MTAQAAPAYWLCCGSQDQLHPGKRQPDCFDPTKAVFRTKGQAAPAAFGHAALVQALRNGGERLLREIDEESRQEYLRWRYRARGAETTMAELDRVQRSIRAQLTERVYRREVAPWVDLTVRMRMLSTHTVWVIEDGGPMRVVDDGLTPAQREAIAQVQERMDAVAESLGLTARRV